MLLTLSKYHKHAPTCCRFNDFHFRDIVILIDFFRTLSSLNWSRGAHQKRDAPLERILLAHTNRECKDPRDKIFGLLALVDITQYKGLVPNYKLDWEEVFIQTTRAMLCGDGDSRGLTSLCTSGRGPKHNPQLPSWVRDFAKPISKAHLDAEKFRMEMHHYIYKASAQTIAYTSFPHSTQLELIGALLDTVGLLGRTPDPIWNLGESFEVLREWMVMALTSKDVSEHDFTSNLASNVIQWEPFWRTMLAGSMNENKSHTQVALRAYEAKDIGPSRNFFSWLLELGPSGLDAVYNNQILAAISGRSFFLTKKGNFGLCYPKVQPDDEIWVVHGAPAPFILRPCHGNRRGDSGARYFHYLGDCYVDGFMDGTAFNNVRHNERKIILE
jgi:hypothetical protein